MNRRKIALLSVLIVCLGFTAGGAILAQEDDALPPSIIDIWPLPGVELVGNDPLTLTFDQPMDRATVEAAVSFDPALTVQFDWDDDKTVNIVPVDGWPRASSFAVTIAQRAAAANGLTLVEAVSFDVRTIGMLEVIAMTPTDGADGVAADARIVVTFNRPVVALVATSEHAELPSPVVISPAIEGEGQWLNTSIYEFTPAEALAGSTSYTVTVSAGLTSVLGAELAEDSVVSFKTLTPQILSVSPSAGETNVTLERTISITFSQPMDHASTEEAFSLLYYGEPVQGSFSWNSTSTQFTYTPFDNLVIQSPYVINIAASARSASGEAQLDNGVSSAFNTVLLPGIERTSPQNGERDVYPGRGASITFRSPMNTDTFEDKVVIVPETEWRPSVWNNSSLGIEFSALANTNYSITFLAGAEDVYGNAITTDYTFTYTTGTIPTWAYPITGNGMLPVLGAHRENTRIPLMISGTPKVDFTLYTVDPVALQQWMQYYRGDENPPWLENSNLVRRWTQQFDSQGLEGKVVEVLLASDEGGQLPEGLYWLETHGPDSQQHDWFPLVVASTNLTVKRSPDETLVWLTDMPTAEPVVESTVSIFDERGQMVARGHTDGDGVFRTSIETHDRLFVLAEGAASYGVWYSNNASWLPTTQDYVYTDRPIYRPGETVYFRGVLRDKADMDYSLPNMRSIYATVYSPYGGDPLFEGDIPVTEFGTFSGEFELAEDAPIGSASIQVRDAYLSFTIAEFRVPEFEVTVVPQQDEIFQGDELSALVEASYFFGGGVSGADVNWYASGEPTSFSYTGPGRYNFDDSTLEWPYMHVGDGVATTDANGRFLITSTNTHASAPRPMRITVEATVTDESMQSISGRSSLIAHPANVYVGLRSDRYFGSENQPYNIDLIAVNTSSDPLADKRITLEVVEIRWERVPVEGEFGRYNWQREEIIVETDEVRTGEDGTAAYAFTPPQAGIYRVRATALDEYERSNSSTLRFWVTGSRPVWWGEPSRTIDLLADRDSYEPGDTAQILVQIPFAGASTVLVSTERAGIMQHEVIEVEGSTLLYELPITSESVPTIHVDVTVVKGIDEESLNPDYRAGRIALDVKPTESLLTVTVTPSSPLTQPGDVVTFDVRVVDANGMPVQAEFGLALTDKAILSLMSPNSGTLSDTFYGWQSNYVYTEHSLDGLLDRLTDEYVPDRAMARGGGMDEAEMVAAPMAAQMGMTMEDSMVASEGAFDGEQKSFDDIDIREDFQQTPLWEGHVTTDVEGFAQVSVTLPDNLTTWVMDARGITLQTMVGQAETEIMTTLPLLIRPVTPRFMVVEDRVQLAAVVNNNTAEAQTVQVRLDAEGVTLEGEATQTVTIEAASRARVEWWVVAEDVPYADFTFLALGADGYQDAAKPALATGPDGTIPIYRYTAPDTVGTGGVLFEGGAVTEAISLPPRLDVDQGELTIKLDPSLAATVTDTFDYLKNYPHQCIEQTVSRFLPNAVTYRALTNLGIQDPVLEANLHTALTQGLDILTRTQNPDGGWGWFGHMESNPLVTAYAALGLIESQGAGFELDNAMIDRALNFVRSDLTRVQLDTSEWRLNRQAFYLYVLARGEQNVSFEMMALNEFRLKLSVMGRSYLLMAYNELIPDDRAVDDLVSDLTTAAILSATGAHWEEANRDWWNWGSNTRSTALALAALTRVEPEHPLLPNVVRWLMVARQGDHWATTQEDVWAIISFTDWMVHTGELNGDFDYAASLNRDDLTAGTVTPETVRDGEILRVDVRDLLLDDINRLSISRSEGEGVLYYTAHMNLRLPAAETPALSRGVAVTREYFAADDPETRITDANLGDIITVRVTLHLEEDIYYFVLEDPIPAGTEGVDMSLLTTSRQATTPNLVPDWGWGYEPYWYWGWWWFDHTEMRDEQVNLYADYLPRGTYVYTYEVRASIAGEFQTMPSHAYAFYFPEVFGRGAGELFTVHPEE